MVTRVLLSGMLLSILIVAGCEQQTAATSPQAKLKQEVRNQLAISCDGCNSYMALYVDPTDILEARYPSGNDPLYLTVVGEDGQPIKCCNSPMRAIVNDKGELMLHCPHCGKLKPLAVRNGKVYVE